MLESMNTSAFIAGLAAAALWSCPDAQAAPVLITAFGTITAESSNVPAHWEGYQSPFVLGDTITASLTYDSDAAYGTVPVSGFVTGYFPAQGVITTATGWSDSAWSYFNVGTNQITFTGQHGDSRYVSSFPLFYYATTLTFTGGLGSIPPSALDASTFVSGAMTGLFATTPFLDSSFTARVDRITAVVTPVPAAGWLFVTALAGLAGLGRKHLR
jgi:hypothetical protein